MTKTSIEWAMNPDGTRGEVWNPVTGCNKVSQGCKNCYAERIAARFWSDRPFTEVRLHPERLDDPLHWKKPRRVFVNSMSDLFHPAIPFEYIKQVFLTMMRAENHTFMVLTKRPKFMIGFLDGLQWGTLPKNIWWGVSVEDQKVADERIPLLLQTPAAVRFVSCEPLLGPVDIKGVVNRVRDQNPEVNRLSIGLNWVIVGGESGPNARPMNPDWARSIRDQCHTANIPFFFKQFGEWVLLAENYEPGHQLYDRIGKKAAGRLLDGVEWNQYPEDGK